MKSNSDAEMGRLDAMGGLIGRAWPAGLSDAERVMIQRLSADDRRKLVRRLAVVLRWTEPVEGEEQYAGADAAAADAGLATGHFYRMVRAWKAARTVASLGFKVGGASKRSSSIDGGTKRSIIETALRLIEREPGASTGRILNEIESRHADAPSKTTLLRLIEEARRTVPTGRFGERIVFDSAGLDLVDPEGFRVRLYAALDEGTGLILGRAIGTERWGAVGYVYAAEHARDGLSRFDGYCESSDPIDVVVRMSPGDARGAEMFATIGIAPTFPSGVDRLGRRLVMALGDRVGSTWLGTGEREEGTSFRTGRREHLPEVTNLMANMIGEAIDASNDQKMKRLESVGSGAPANASIHGMAAQLKEIEDLVLLIDDPR